MPNVHSTLGPRLGARAIFLAAGAMALSLAAAAHAGAAASEAQRQADWRETMKHMPSSGGGCFTATYPTAAWVKADCVAAPQIPFIPRHGHGAYTVGNGNDYAAVVTGLVSNGEGSFPAVTVTKETDGGAPNTYSIQLNSQFFASPACSGATNPSKCLGWEQFVYSSSSRAGFMQYWLITYGSKCPSGGWMSYSGDCYRNSAAVSIPTEAITNLGSMTLTGNAVSAGLDTLTFTVGTKAYRTTGADTVVTLANYWNAAEFNVIGDGGGSEAVFKRGTNITVSIALTDGLTAAPVCKSDDGTTGETNNLTLHACTASGGSTPSVSFTESN
jgi:hypothetical protein